MEAEASAAQYKGARFIALEVSTATTINNGADKRGLLSNLPGSMDEIVSLSSMTKSSTGLLLHALGPDRPALRMVYMSHFSIFSSLNTLTLLRFRIASKASIFSSERKDITFTRMHCIDIMFFPSIKAEL